MQISLGKFLSLHHPTVNEVPEKTESQSLRQILKKSLCSRKKTHRNQCKMSPSKKIDLSRQVSEFICRLESQFLAYMQSCFMFVFATHFCDMYSPLLPLPSSLWLNPPPPLPCFKNYFFFRYTFFWGGGGERGMAYIGFLETTFCRSFTLCVMNRFRTSKLIDHPKLKT